MVSDDAAPEDLTTADIYGAVRQGVRDAVWDVLGTIAMLVFYGIAFMIAAGFVARSLTWGTEFGWLAVAFGVTVMALLALLALRELRVYPFEESNSAKLD